MKNSEAIEQFRNHVAELQSRYKIDFENVNLCDKATNDLLHDLELGDAKERDKIATKISNVRKARRIYKDYVEVSQPLIDLLETPEAKSFMKKLSECLGATRKIEKTFENRKYFPRVIRELTFLKDYNTQ